MITSDALEAIRVADREAWIKHRPHVVVLVGKELCVKPTSQLEAGEKALETIRPRQRLYVPDYSGDGHAITAGAA